MVSEQALHALCRPSSSPPNYHEKLDQTGWLQHLQAILTAAAQVGIRQGW